MKGDKFVKDLRHGVIVANYKPDGTSDEGEIFNLLADAVEEADGSFRDLLQSECVMASSDATVAGDVLTISRPWWDTGRILDGCGGEIAIPCRGTLTRAISYLERRGLIERKDGEPHMVRFVE